MDTITSLELVEFINSQRKEGEPELRHDHFMAKVPQVLGAEVAPNFRGYYKASNGKQNPMYTFPKREACLMAMSYSYEIQAKVFDKMTELEQKLNASIAALPDFTNPVIAARAWAAEVEAKMIAHQEIAEKDRALAIAVPKVAALDRIAASDGEMNLQAAGKVLQQPPNKFIVWMRAHGWIYKRAGGSVNYAYAEKEKSGYLTMRTTEIHLADGQAKQRPYCHITHKGLVRLAKVFSVSINADLFTAAA